MSAFGENKSGTSQFLLSPNTILQSRYRIVRQLGNEIVRVLSLS